LALWICGCRERVSPRPRNLLLVTIDTVRADHLRAYGYSAAETLAGEKHFREAAQAYKEAIRISPSAAGPIALALARVSLALGELKEAELNAGLAMRESPAEAHEVLAQVALARNDLDAAEREISLGAGTSGVGADGAVILAEVRLRRDQPLQALALLDSALNLLLA
jgi:tetratricopeptide (TPR) repeat protein